MNSLLPPQCLINTNSRCTHKLSKSSYDSLTTFLARISTVLKRGLGRNEPLVGSTTWKTLRAYIENWIQRRETVLMLESAGG